MSLKQQPCNIAIMKRFIIFLMLNAYLFAITGYVRSTGPSICMDNCSLYYLENEDGEFLSYITYLDSIQILEFYNDRFVDIEGDIVQCVECEAIDITSITLSSACQTPVNCLVDPCSTSVCVSYPSSECIPNYCGGCWADYYLNNELVHCELNPGIEWNFSISEPVIEIFGGNDLWHPGNTIFIEMDFCNNTDQYHGWYPGVVLESDSNLTTIFNNHFWFYGMDSNTCNSVQFTVLADSSISSDTMITFIAYPKALNCYNQPEYCIESDSVVFEILISLDYVSSQSNNTTPIEFALQQNYPNPFNPVTKLRYTIPKKSHVEIIIYDMLGRQVKTLINQTQDAGYRSVTWDATNDYGKPMSAGIYLYQIQVGEYKQTKKMILLK